MKNKSIYITTVLLSLLIIGNFNACKKSLDTNNINVVTTNEYFKTSSELLNGTNAIYSALHSFPLVANEWYFIHDLRSDEAASGGGQLGAAYLQILTGNLDAANGEMNNMWSALYTMIHRANTVIENGPSVTDNVALRDRAVGEAKFLRAWAYFELVSMWGGVPIYTTAANSATDYKPRSTVEQVYQLVIQDLTDAASVLPGKSNTDKGRATNAAAYAMLGRVLMQKGDYANAKAALLKIPTSGADGYFLTARYLDNFEEETEFNQESIFEVAFVDKGDNNFNWGQVGDGATAAQSTARNQQYCPVAWRNVIPSNKLLNEFENTATGAAKSDPRYSYSFYQTGDSYNNNTAVLEDADQNGNSSVVNGVTKKVSFRKYMLIYKQSKSQASFYIGGNNQRMIRYAEVLINLAECENELGNIPSAISYLNNVRARPSVNMPAYPTAQYPVGTKEELIKAIMHEKSVEMGDEEVRDIDILRWRKKGYFKTDPLSYFKPQRDELMPIPTSELDNNPLLKGQQNPGY